MDSRKTEKLHGPFLREAEGSDTAVLLVHGIFGSPNQFEDIARSLFAQGCSVMAILLPGHGGSAADFAKTKASAWQRAVGEAAAYLRQRYRRVFLLGHSMGGLLSLCEAAENGADGVILLSVPMRLKTSWKTIRISVNVLWGDPARDNDFLKSYRLAYSVERGSVWQYIRWTPRMAELARLIGKARRVLGRIQSPSLIIQSRRDETVSWKSARVLERGLRSASAVDVLMLEKSSHSYFDPAEACVLRQKICGFVKGGIQQ